MKKDRPLKLNWVFLSCLLLILASPEAHGTRLKDIASIGGVRDNQLIGYGLVVGLAGTGDDVKNGFTRETLVNLLSRQGLSLKDKDLKSKNIAAVMLTATLPPFAKAGSRIDVMVSSLGDAKSLLGGTLLLSPLRAADGEVYALAQGAITIGGFGAAGAGAGVVKNHTSVGRIINGATVERELAYDFKGQASLTLNLHNPDFTTAARALSAIRETIENVDAQQLDSSTILVRILPGYQGNPVNLAARLENIPIVVDTPALVVMNEKTGTVVMGEKVRISTVAVAHGNLSIRIKEEARVSQPAPFAPKPPPGVSPPAPGPGGTIVAPGGQTVVTRDTDIAVTEEKRQLLLVPQGVTIQEVVQALNAIGVTPRDLITILQTIKAAGALQADLRIM